MITLEVAQEVLTIEEYFKMEDASFEKHEFDNGTLIAMAGSPAPHNAVKGWIFVLLENFFVAKNLPLFAFDSDTKIRIERSNRFYYPDISVIFDEPEFYTSPNGTVRRNTMTNPILVVEVLSKSTRQRDKGEKFENYRTLPTFREYLLVEPEKMWVETRFKSDPARDLWEIKNFTDPDEVFSLQSIGLEIKVSEIYARLKWLKLA